MSQQETSNRNDNNNMQSIDSSPIPYESSIYATKDKPLNYNFSKPVQTCTNASKRFVERTSYREFSLFSIQRPPTSINFLNSDIKASEINNAQQNSQIIFKIPQPEQPTLILKEYNILQSYLKTTGNSNIHQNQIENLDERETISRSKSGEVVFRPPEAQHKKKPGPKKKLMEPVRLYSSRHKFPNKPYAPYEEIIGYVDGYPYDHFGFREERSKVENEDPNEKIVELMNKIQKIANHKYDEREKIINQKFRQVEKNPTEILIINENKLEYNDKNSKNLPSIQINKDMFKTVILPAPVIRNPPNHIFLRRILKKELNISKKIYQTASKLMMCWKSLKTFQKSDISKYTTFNQLAAESWPKLYHATMKEVNHEKVDVRKMIDRYHRLFVSIEEIELMYYSELLHIVYDPNSLVSFNYNPKAIFD